MFIDMKVSFDTCETSFLLLRTYGSRVYQQPFSSLQLCTDLVSTSLHPLTLPTTDNPPTLLALIPNAVFNYCRNYMNLLYSSYLYLSSFIIISSRSFISRARLLRSAQDIRPHLNTLATRNASPNSTAWVRGRWQRYKSGSRTFCGAVMQKISANCWGEHFDKLLLMFLLKISSHRIPTWYAHSATNMLVTEPHVFFRE